MRPLLRVTGPLAAVALATGAAGCGEDTINDAKAEETITKEVEAQVGADVGSVSCPGDVKAEKGGTFTCVVTGADGTKGEVRVTQKDDKGNVHFSAPFLHMDEVERNLGTNFSAKFKTKVTLRCPDIITPKAGGKFVCDATDADGNKAKVDVTERDALGNFDATIRSK